MEKEIRKQDNIEFLISIHRLLLEAVEMAIYEDLPADDDQRKAIIAKYDRLFGAKQSIASVLGEVADTELKIDKQRPKPPVVEEADIPLEEADIQLIKDFVKQQHVIPSPLEGEG